MATQKFTCPQPAKVFSTMFRSKTTETTPCFFQFQPNVSNTSCTRPSSRVVYLTAILKRSCIRKCVAVPLICCGIFAKGLVPGAADGPIRLPYAPHVADVKRFEIQAPLEDRGPVVCTVGDGLLGWCLIKGMPIIAQGDEGVKKATSLSLTSYAQTHGQGNPTAVDPDTGKRVPELLSGDFKTYKLPKDLATDEADYGCALTAHTMLIQAVLARAPRTITFDGLAKQYMEAKVPPNLSQDQSKLVWQYVDHVIAFQDKQAQRGGGIAAEEFVRGIRNWPYFVPRTVTIGSDGGPDDIAAAKTNFSAYTTASLASNLSQGALIMVAFHWSRLAFFKSKDGVVHIIRDDYANHKIALRGYRRNPQQLIEAPGVYPIVANDPGSGKLTTIRLTSNLREFGLPGTPAVNAKIHYDFYDENTKQLYNLGSVDPGWLALIYNGSEPTVGNPAAGKDVPTDLGLGGKLTFYPIEFIDAITTTFIDFSQGQRQ